MENDAKLEVGYGLAKGDNAFAAGVEAARQARRGIDKYSPALVLVFASVRYDLEELLRGVQTMVGEAPLVGATTAGEICNGPHRESVVVVALASPYLTVRVGVGQGVARNWRQAVNQAIFTPEVAPFFSPRSAVWSELTLQGKSVFGLVFSPGNTKSGDSQGFEILEELKRRSGGRLPIMGGSAADDWRMATNYVLYGSQAYPDSLLVVVCETQLRFGLALAHGFSPTRQKATVTRATAYEVRELDHQPADEVFSRLQGASRADLEGQHLTLTTKRPAGILDPYKQYSINIASFFTAAGGVRFSQPVAEGALLTVMDADEDNLIAASQEALRKAMLRSSINVPALILIFSCAVRARILGDRAGEEVAGIRNLLPQVPVVGFYSFGEQGLADDGVNRHNNGVITILVLGRELSYPAQVALENRRLRNEVEQAEALRIAYAALEKEVANRKKAELARADSERFLANIFDCIQDGLSVLDRDFNICRANPAMENFFPASVGKKCYAVRHGRQTPCEGCPAQTTWETGETAHKIISGSQGEGSKWIDLYTYPLVDSITGKITGVIEYAKDITELVQAEQAYRQSTQRLEALINASPLAIYVMDFEGRVQIWNPAAERIFGWTKEEAMGQRLPIIPEDKLEEFDLVFRQALAGKLSAGIELSRRKKDDSPIQISVYTAPLYDDRGEVTGVLAIAADITDRHRAEEEILKANHALENVFASTVDSIATVNRQGRFTQWNAAAEELFGYAFDEVRGKPYSVLYADPGELGVMLTQLHQRGYLRNYEISMRKKDGSTFPCSISLRRLRDLDNRVTGGIAVGRDLSEIKLAEAERQRLSKMEAIGTLAGGIAHDFNNILTVIIGNISLAMLDLERQRGARERLEEAERACQQAQNLSRQLLTFSKGGAPIKKIVSIKEIATESASFACRGSRVNYQPCLPNDLWAVEADPGQINQVFHNLVINAIQAMPSGGKIRITGENLSVAGGSESAMAPGRYVKISIQDEGMGIPVDHLSKIFDPYFTTKQRGSGLGLATVYSIIKNHQGHISVESKVEKGTTFRVYLPAGDQGFPQELKGDTGLISGKGKILIMDDEPMVREVLGKMVQTLGYEVELAKDGMKAIELYTQARDTGDPFVSVILDLTIPDGMGGKEAMERLLQIDPQVKAIVSSGYSGDPIMADFKQYGFIDVIAKPFRISDIDKVLEKAITRAK